METEKILAKIKELKEKYNCSEHRPIEELEEFILEGE